MVFANKELGLLVSNENYVELQCTLSLMDYDRDSRSFTKQKILVVHMQVKRIDFSSALSRVWV